MSKQPEALRLADALRDSVETDGEWSQEQVVAAAAELRRSHSKIVDLEESVRILLTVVSERDRIEAQRDALLEALKSTGLFLHHCWCDVQTNDYSVEKLNQQMAVVDAAIAKAEENT